MSFTTGVYLGLVNLAAFTFLRPWPSTLLGTAAALVSNNLTIAHLLKRDSTCPSIWMLLASGATVLCARTMVPTTPLEVIPYALTYMTMVSIPYICCYRRRSPPAPAPESPKMVVTERVVRDEMPIRKASPADQLPEEPEPVIVVVVTHPTPKSPHTEDEYDHLNDEGDSLLT